MTAGGRADVLTVGIGLVAGSLSGLLGVGGGVVMVPLLVAAVGATQHQAHATSLAAIVPIAAAGALPFALEGRAEPGIAVLLAVGALVGAPLGARVMARTKEAPLKVMFGCFMLAVGVRLLWP